MRMLFVFLIYSYFSLSATGFKYLITNPILGFSHIKFNCQIADVLAEAGHNVTVFNFHHIPVPNIDKLVKNPNVTIINYYPDNFEKIKTRTNHTLPDLWAGKYDNMIRANFRAPATINGFLENTYSQLLRDTKFLDFLRAQNFDAVVAELFELGGMYIAHLIKAPAVIAIMSSVRYPYTEQLFGQPSSLSYIPGRFSKIGKEATVWDRLNDIYHDSLFTLLHKSYSEAQNDMFNSLIGYELPNWKDVVQKATYFIANTNPYLDFAIPKTANIIPVGGFTIDKSSKTKLSEEYDKIMGETTVIISFGSVVRSFEMPEEFKTGLIEMFKSFPNVTFIWKYEKDDVEFKKRLGPNVHLKSWMPQSALLGDKRVRLFITHGGLASTMEVAYSGTPALVVPLFSDQFHNAQMLARHGGAIAYDKYELGQKEKLISIVREFLETSRFSDNAQYLANVLHNQPTDPKQTLITHMEFAAKFPNLKSLVPENNSNNFIAFYYLDAISIIIGCTVLVIYLLQKVLLIVMMTRKVKKD